MAKMFLFNEKALRSILNGVKTLAKAVKVTLGPKGKNVLIKKDYSNVISTKDGVSVAKEIILKDKFENMGTQIVKEAALKTADTAGDGTTTAIVLAEAIFSEGLKNVIAHSNPMALKKGIEKAVKFICEKLDDITSEIRTEEEIQQIACISANNDEDIGSIISNAMKRVGKDGIITMADGKGIDTTLDVVEGMQFTNGFISPYFITNPEKMIVEMDNPLIYITDKKLSSAKDVVKVLEKIMKNDISPLLIIADDVDSDALTTLVVNRVKANLPICAVRAPFFGSHRKDVLKDIAIITGGEVISEDKGMDLENFDINKLGKAKKVKISKDATTIIDGIGSKNDIEQREKEIRAEIANTTSQYEKEKLEERLAHLIGGVAVIHVGAATEAEMKEKKQRVEDALHATKAAAMKGTVPGGGVALLRCAIELDNLQSDDFDEKLGIQIVKKACFAPAITIANNCGKNGDLIAEKIIEKKGAWGYNAVTDQFADLIKDGVIDPVLVTKNALINAASVSSLLLTIDAMITDKPEPKKKQNTPLMDPSMDDYSSMGGMPMGGMPMGGMPMM